MPDLLIVDDHEPMCHLLAQIFEGEGCVVATALTGEEAIRSIAASQPRLVVLDVMLPGISGWDVLKIIRKSHSSKELPVIICSGMTDTNTIAMAEDLGANQFWIKGTKSVDEMIYDAQSFLLPTPCGVSE